MNVQDAGGEDDLFADGDGEDEEDDVTENAADIEVPCLCWIPS